MTQECGSCRRPTNQYVCHTCAERLAQEVASVAEDRTTRIDHLRRNVGTCPACRDYLFADVTVVTTIKEPGWSSGANPSPNASANAVAMVLHHECDKRKEDQ